MAKYIVQHRRGTAAQWAKENTIIPKEGELVIEIDEINSLHKLKIGDGIHTYAELAYLQAGDEIVTQVLNQALPRVVTITLDVDRWTEVTCATNPNLGYYGQSVTLDDITIHSRLDLQPNADMLAEFQNLNLVFTTENKDGVITVYSVGDMPLQSYTMQATIVETDLVVDIDRVTGIPVGTPTTKSDWNQTDETKADYIKNKPFDDFGEAVNGVVCLDYVTKENHSKDVARIEGSIADVGGQVSDLNCAASYDRLGMVLVADNEELAADTGILGGDYRLQTVCATEGDIDGGTNLYKPIVPANLEYAVKSVGDGYYALDDILKIDYVSCETHSRDIATLEGSIASVGQSVINLNRTASPNDFGMVKVANDPEIAVNTGILGGDEMLKIVSATEADIDEQTSDYKPITPTTIDYAVKTFGDKYYAKAEDIGDIETALDSIIAEQESIIAIQNALIGGENV